MNAAFPVSAGTAMIDATTSPTDWCILRCSAARTLPLAASLNEAGIEAWTPMKVEKRRLPRGRKGHREIEAPIMPTFVFVRYSRLVDLMIILELPISPHPGFSVFRHLGLVPHVSNREIERLRTEEGRAQRKDKRPAFAIGEQVRVEEEVNFTGLKGVVQGHKGRYTMVCFGGAIQFSIATINLRTNEVQAAA